MHSPLGIDAGEYDVTDRRILVTGGAGFIGSHLVDTLVEDNAVTVLDDFSNGRAENVHLNANVIDGDVRDREVLKRAMRDTEIVFHQAGIVSVEQSISSPTTSHDVNAGGAVTVLDVARQTDTRVVAASSAAVYGHPPEVPISEDTRFRPTSPYGIDKATLDHYTRQVETLYGLPTVSLRYFNVYGPRQSATDYSGVISTFGAQAAAGERLTVHGDGTQTRDFVHVSDVVRANLCAATTDHTGEAFNIGTGEQTSINELAALVCEVTGSDPGVTHTAGRDGDIDHSCADTDKASNRLGFEAEVDLASGLRTILTPSRRTQ
ncbi:NAD-dependent epimerase/dehydratase family protein [Halovenus sp. WSH3]|uniref:NAD-dependent epimerase/dehydratase family protein n=1 Tax=Halovenus carboxidivorans TaxID=2692199 RepID=A0A6B0T4D8_9EURY|nr:NAD-dependent epimerase/dehydratase family protein [Halovenus carboxidivorans]MXR52975.1 NAD-dependent epimerase/dehydratase family protein [Halovenus carboxidivorans]